MAAGKTTLATYLSRKYDYKILPLAQPIKDMEQALASGESPLSVANRFMSDTLDPMQLAMMVKILEEALLIPRESPKPRKRLQFIGTEGGRKRISSSIWIDYTAKLAEKYDRVAIDDVRFTNEYGRFYSADWRTIFLKITPNDQLERLHSLYPDFDEQSLTHDSEVELENLEHFPHDLIIDVTSNNILAMYKIMDEWICRL